MKLNRTSFILALCVLATAGRESAGQTYAGNLQVVHSDCSCPEDDGGVLVFQGTFDISVEGGSFDGTGTFTGDIKGSECSLLIQLSGTASPDLDGSYTHQLGCGSGFSSSGSGVVSGQIDGQTLHLDTLGEVLDSEGDTCTVTGTFDGVSDSGAFCGAPPGSAGKAYVVVGDVRPPPGLNRIELADWEAKQQEIMTLAVTRLQDNGYYIVPLGGVTPGNYATRADVLEAAGDANARPFVVLSHSWKDYPVPFTTDHNILLPDDTDDGIDNPYVLGSEIAILRNAKGMEPLNELTLYVCFAGKDQGVSGFAADWNVAEENTVTKADVWNPLAVKHKEVERGCAGPKGGGPAGGEDASYLLELMVIGTEGQSASELYEAQASFLHTETFPSGQVNIDDPEVGVILEFATSTTEEPITIGATRYLKSPAQVRPTNTIVMAAIVVISSATDLAGSVTISYDQAQVDAIDGADEGSMKAWAYDATADVNVEFLDALIDTDQNSATFAIVDSSEAQNGLFLLTVADPCPADTDDSGTVDVVDLVNVFLDWGSGGSVNGGDVDGSGTVDVSDLVEVILAWGPCE